MQKAIAAVVALGFIGLVLWLFLVYGGSAQTPTTMQTPETPVATAHYQCDAGKTIAAEYYQGESKPSQSADQPPTPGGSANITLSDGRSATLPQALSGSGIRYANADESMVLWSKGNTAFLTENNKQTFANCIKIADDPGGLPQVFEDGTKGFSIRYPADYTVDPSYTYQALGPGKGINGVKFTVGSSTTAGTNLAQDTYLSVESLPQVQACDASLFVEKGAKARNQLSADGTQYSVASTTGAAAGNRYEETVYAIPDTNSCIGVRYFIHYGVIENYPAGSIKQFDEAALLNTFDKIRKTLVLGQ